MALDFNSQGLFGKDNLFKNSPEDNQIFFQDGGQTRPGEPGTTNYYRDDFTGTSLDENNRWAKTTAGSGSVSVSGGECTLSTGATNGSSAKIKLKLSKQLISASTISMQFRAKISMTAANAADWELAIYNAAENRYVRLHHATSDLINEFDSVFEDGTGEVGGVELQTFNNAYHLFRVNLGGSGGAFNTLFDDATIDTGSGVTTINSIDFYLYIKISNNAASNQTITLDWVEFA